MRTRIAHSLEFAKKAVLATVGIAAVAQSAILSPQGKPRPAFEVASVKPIDRSTMSRGHEGHQLTPERFVGTQPHAAGAAGGSISSEGALGNQRPSCLRADGREKRTKAQADSKAADGTLIESQGGGGLTTVPMPNGTLRTRFNFQASSMEEAARSFAFFFDRPVIDRTNLKGDYDFTIEYEDDQDARIPLNPFSGLTPSALSAALASVGLKLESTKAPIKVLVIDHVEKPTEN